MLLLLLLLLFLKNPSDVTLGLGLQESRFSFACQKSYLRVDIFHKENFMEIPTKQTNLFFDKKKNIYIYIYIYIKNKVAVSTTKYQKSAFFSLQCIYNDFSKSTEILSVCSFCFYRLFPIQKYICNQRLLFTGKYVVFETSICFPEMIL